MNILKSSLVLSPLLLITLSNFSLPAANAQNSGTLPLTNIYHQSGHIFETLATKNSGTRSFTGNNNKDNLYSQRNNSRPFSGNNNRDDNNGQNSENRPFGGNNNNTGNNGQNSGDRPFGGNNNRDDNNGQNLENRPKIFCRLRPGVWVLCKLLQQQQQQQNSPTENTTPDTNQKRPALNRLRN